MDLKGVVEVGSAIIISLGGGGGIVFGLSNYLGKIWADRGLERQKQEYSQLNIALQTQLDFAARRLQVELDALGLVHKLRTQEEFSRLSGLWKAVANVRNYFAGLAHQGMSLQPADRNARKIADAHIRQQFESFLNTAQMFLAEEALFIPKHICDVAETALKAANEERYNFVAFAPYLETELSAVSGPDVPELVDMRRNYTNARSDSFRRFTEATNELEQLMRRYIAGASYTSQEHAEREQEEV